MKIYIDNDFKCHVAPSDGLREFEVDFFDGKCGTYIEGHRLVPEGYIWTREDGEIFGGNYTMTSPWLDIKVLEAAQAAYEQARAELLVPAEAAYQEGVNSI